LKKDLTFLCLLSTDCKFFFANFLAFFPSFPIPFLSLPKNITKISIKEHGKLQKEKNPESTLCLLQELTSLSSWVLVAFKTWRIAVKYQGK
jgi:hypothetical protein